MGVFDHCESNQCVIGDRYLLQEISFIKHRNLLDNVSLEKKMIINSSEKRCPSHTLQPNINTFQIIFKFERK